MTNRTVITPPFHVDLVGVEPTLPNRGASRQLRPLPADHGDFSSMASRSLISRYSLPSTDNMDKRGARPRLGVMYVRSKASAICSNVKLMPSL